MTKCSSRHAFFSVAAFTLTELLVVVAILAILAATQLPALNRAKTPVKHAQCMNNCRQIAQATLLYKDGHNDIYPTGQRVYSPASVAAETGWPRLLLHYMGGYNPSNQPTVYVCPNEKLIVPNVPFQLHFQGNREMICDINDCVPGVRGSQVRKPSIYWMFMEKGPYDAGSIKEGALEQIVLGTWNITTGLAGYRRHNGGLIAAAADGHADWLRMPPYQPSAPTPPNLVELGDCAEGNNPAPYGIWINNGPRAKLFCHARPGGIL